MSDRTANRKPSMADGAKNGAKGALTGIKAFAARMAA
jgi:hypothetical protein